jgi:hypothetical protein
MITNHELSGMRGERSYSMFEATAFVVADETEEYHDK